MTSPSVTVSESCKWVIRSPEDVLSKHGQLWSRNLRPHPADHRNGANAVSRVTRSFDVVILGGGNAEMGLTLPTKEAGLKVAMIEPDLLGGTCPNRGCMPKKVLVAAAHALDEIERAKAHHIAVGKPSLD